MDTSLPSFEYSTLSAHSRPSAHSFSVVRSRILHASKTYPEIRFALAARSSDSHTLWDRLAQVFRTLGDTGSLLDFAHSDSPACPSWHPGVACAALAPFMHERMLGSERPRLANTRRPSLLSSGRSWSPISRVRTIPVATSPQGVLAAQPTPSSRRRTTSRWYSREGV